MTENEGMEVQHIIEAVCRIPLDWNRLGVVSLVELLKASGYVDHVSTVGESELATFLRSNPDVIGQWVDFSEGKRVSEGWYLLPPGSSFDGRHWVVGYYPEGKRFCALDGAEACAYYIKQEIEGWRT